MKNGVSVFACSETQKFGHVTFFWNGNRSGYFDAKLETYLEVRECAGGNAAAAGGVCDADMGARGLHMRANALSFAAVPACEHLHS